MSYVKRVTNNGRSNTANAKVESSQRKGNIKSLRLFTLLQ